MASTVIRAFTLAVAAAQVAVVSASPAFISLTYPAPDDAPMSAQVLGVDAASGHTTYAVARPEADGNGSTVGVFTQTVIAGSDYLSMTLSAVAPEETFVEGFECNFVDGDAVCVGAEDGVDQTTTVALASFGTEVLDVVESGSASATTTSPTSSGLTSASASSSGSGSAVQPSKTPSAGIKNSNAVGFGGMLVGLVVLAAQLA
ncbi:hypothetical protein C8F01DRAFT_1098749 [Mycena amicta]|nr:hypothetical protein C8F01DRAFT_1098749 [Mycena amicta]